MNRGYESLYPSNTDSGLSKREHFAAIAMQGLISAKAFNLCDYDYLVKEAVVCADALIKELDK